MSDNFTYRAGYAQIDRTLCSRCKKEIANGELRLAVVVQVGI
jgi:hypothetical protein